MRKTLLFIVALLAGGVLLAGNTLLARAATQITRSVFGGGGGRAASTHHAMTATAGQDVVGRSASLHHVLGHGFWAAPPQATGVDQPPDIPVPDRWRLHRNAPNPFNPRTTIAFDVPAPGGDVQLHVFDLRGRLVRTLWSGPVAPGVRQAIWNGADDAGRPVASSVYVVVMRSPAGSFSRAVTLVR